MRKDGKGIPIIKKKLLFKKTKHHAYLKDDLFANEAIANIIDIPSYKKYNREDVIEEEEDNSEEKIENSMNNNNSNVEINKDMQQCQCCSIFWHIIYNINIYLFPFIYTDKIIVIIE